MKLLKPDPDFEKKLVKWYGEEPEQDFVDSIDKVALAYEKWGREDAVRGRPVASQGCFQALGKLCFPNDENCDMVSTVADYMKACYMSGYQEGGAA